MGQTGAMEPQVRPQVRRFYDGGRPAVGDRPETPPDPTADPRIVLERHSEDGVESFSMERRIGYLDRHLGELLVPADPDAFRTDLTSVPSIWTWLVPRTGAHLPAALLHDGLVMSPGDSLTYVSTDGHQVHRIEADRVFRDAMADTGTGVVRRWLVWAAVSMATLLVGRDIGIPSAAQWRYRVAIVSTLVGVMVLGAWATLDLFDVGWVPGLPWMGERAWWVELLGGLAGAITIPALLGLTWGRFRVAGWLAGITLALLLHITLGILGITAAYRAAEWIARVAGPPALLVLGALGVVAAGLFLLMILI